MLTPKEELTLMRFVDGELSPLGRFMVKRLLRRPESQEFVDVLARVRNSMVKSVEEQERGRSPGSLWEKVQVRIDQEERAERYLGKRAFSTQGVSHARGIWQFAGGAAVAAAAMFAVAQSQQGGVVGAVASMPSSAAPVREISGVRPVSVGGDISSSRSSRRPLQVEWMKSAGRVNFIEPDDQDDDLAIMWVSRERIPSLGASIFSAPTSQARSNVPVLINENLPTDVPVFAPKEDQ